MPLDRLFGEKSLTAGIISDLASAEVVELSALAGFDYYLLDAEHALLSSEACVTAVSAARGFGIPIIFRTAEHRSGDIGTLLDMGFDGVVIPHMSDTGKLCEALARAWFPPKGSRGMGLCRASGYSAAMDTAAFLDRTNADRHVIMQIEDAEGVGNLEALLAVPGVAAVLAGTRDLSLSLGCPGVMNDPRMNDAVRRCVTVCGERCVPLILPVSGPEAVEKYRAWGARHFLCSFPMLFHRSAKELTDICRESTQKALPDNKGA